MIHGHNYNVDNPTARILKALEVSKYDFHLTGSRALSISDKDSDWDFFVTHDNAIVDFLIDNGFEILGNSSYPDCDNLQELVCIYRHTAARVDVQLVEDANKKQEIQDAIQFVLAGCRNSSKEVKINIWRTAYLAYNCSKNSKKQTFQVGDEVVVNNHGGHYDHCCGKIEEIIFDGMCNVHLYNPNGTKWFHKDFLVHKQNVVESPKNNKFINVGDEVIINDAVYHLFGYKGKVVKIRPSGNCEVEIALSANDSRVETFSPDELYKV